MAVVPVVYLGASLSSRKCGLECNLTEYRQRKRERKQSLPDDIADTVPGERHRRRERLLRETTDL